MKRQRVRTRVYQTLNPEDKDTLVSSFVNYFIIGLILVNILGMSLETVDVLRASYSHYFFLLELLSAVVFLIEYILRFWSAREGDKYRHGMAYFFSFDSLVDLMAILPFYVGYLLGLDLRIFTALRLFRLLKLIRYFSPLAVMVTVLKAESRAFISATIVMLILVFMCATGIYFLEHDIQPEAFGSIPKSLWWSVVTLTTLGYGDVVPITIGGRFFTSMMTIISVGIVALPAAMLASRFSAELHKRKQDYAALVDELSHKQILDPDDRAALERERVRLCLSKTDTSFALAKHKHTGKTFCPHCHERL